MNSIYVYEYEDFEDSEPSDDYYQDEIFYEFPVYRNNDFEQIAQKGISPEIIIIFASLISIIIFVICILSITGTANSGFANMTNETGTETSKFVDSPSNGKQLSSSVIPSSQVFKSPYDSYRITQNLHGFSYGHMAIDIAAGAGTPIKSPINGFVSELFIDNIGNPTLVIENDNYRIMLLHGKYDVSVGDILSIGDIVGSEGNQGYTKDMDGNLCLGRANCGYHTHLNVFDKQLNQNVNPLDLIK